MMTVDEFKSLPEWQKIKEAIMDQLVEAMDNAIKASDFATKEYQRGYLEALKDILNLPNQLLPSNEKPEKDEDTIAGLAIANRPVTGVY